MTGADEMTGCAEMTGRAENGGTEKLGGVADREARVARRPTGGGRTAVGVGAESRGDRAIGGGAGDVGSVRGAPAISSTTAGPRGRCAGE
jgi:hypothetical protein